MCVCTQPAVCASARHLIFAGHAHSVCKFQLSSPHTHTHRDTHTLSRDVTDSELHGNRDRGSERGGERRKTEIFLHTERMELEYK